MSTIVQPTTTQRLAAARILLEQARHVLSPIRERRVHFIREELLAVSNRLGQKTHVAPKPEPDLGALEPTPGQEE